MTVIAYASPSDVKPARGERRYAPPPGPGRYRP
jgi:hypothetical protein